MKVLTISLILAAMRSAQAVVNPADFDAAFREPARGCEKHEWIRAGFHDG